MISVIIPTHHPDLNVLRQVLDSIKTSNECEVVLVENPKKTKEVEELINEWYTGDTISVVHTESFVGANHARNKGADVARGDVLFFTHDDVILSRDILDKYIAAHIVYNAGVIGGPVNLRYTDGKPRWVNNLFETYLTKIDHGHPYGMCPFRLQKEWDLDIPVSAANMSMTKRSFNELGRFNVSEGRIGRNLLNSNDELSLISSSCKNRALGIIYMPEANVTHIIPKKKTTENYFIRSAYGKGVSNFVSFSALNPHLSKLEIYEKILIEHSSLLTNNATSFYTMFDGMQRVERLYATKTYHKANNEYVNGILSQVQI